MKNMKIKKNSLMKVLVLTLFITFLFTTIAFAAGDPIDNATTYARERIATIFLVVVAFYITKHVTKNATNKLIGFVITAILGAVLVYKPEFLKKGADWLYSVFF
ncbi:hypothetical protein [Clostridiisalibacter paucivorans]|uniref:hypothetical protein n=1 Tax=Clostridiisalibacter paucivorans TaxID=408753 RepID=UPI00047CEC4E|nr:hypothetical protein [Clostridiisalibacter paucivorans]